MTRTEPFSELLLKAALLKLRADRYAGWLDSHPEIADRELQRRLAEVKNS